MSKWFCVKNEPIESTLSMLAYVAGGLMKQNNPEIVGRATPIAHGLLAAIESGSNKESVNALFREILSALMENVDKPETRLAIQAALSKVGYDADSDDLPKIDLPLIEALTTGFLEGLTAI
ncbi:MAG: hypothetical protein APR55_07050 [Methanolinea sp. SDB]|nr:MAG: hypothetical protein APR55_07050 [Methanolinea sp. SDB]